MSDKDKLIIKSMRDMRSLVFHFLYVAEAFDYVKPIDEIVEMFRSGFDVDIEDDSRAVIIAFNVIEYCKKKNISIPGELAVVGFGNHHETSYCKPHLT